MTRILKESNIIKQSIVERIKNGSNYPYLYSVIQFGFYDNQGFLLPPSLIRQYWDKEEVKRTCRMIYNLLKEACKIKELYFFIERHAPTRSSITSKEEVKGRFHLNIISSMIESDVITKPDRKMRRLMLKDSRSGNSIRRTNYTDMDDCKVDLFNACCRGANWVNRYKYAIRTQVVKKHNDLVNTILYSLKEYDDKSDVDFMDVCVFEASDYKK